MARVQLGLPENFAYATDTEMRMRITDINYANHLDNAAVLGLLTETRVCFLAQYNLSELDVFGVGLVIADSAVIYKSEAFQGEILRIEVAVSDFSKYGCDFLYRVSEKSSGREVARAKTGIVFFDYKERRVQPVPEPFQSLFVHGSGIVV